MYFTFFSNVIVIEKKIFQIQNKSTLWVSGISAKVLRSKGIFYGPTYSDCFKFLMCTAANSIFFFEFQRLV